MDIGNNSTGVQTRISAKTSLDRNTGDQNFTGQPGYIYERNKFHVRKKGYRKNRSSGISDRFLQHLISGSKKERKNETSNKSKTTKCIFKENSFQNGHHAKGHKLSETKRLGNFSRSQRCLSPCTNLSKSSKVHEVLCKRPMLSVESNVLWPNICSKDIHQISINSGSFSQSSQCETSSLFRRLVHCQPKQKHAVTGSTEMSGSFGITRFSNQSGKVESHSNSKNNISRGTVSFGSRFSETNSRENKQVTNIDSEYLPRTQHGSRFSENVGGNGFLHRVDTECSSIHASHTITSFEFLETKFKRYEQKDTIYTTSKITSFLVDKFSEHAERPIFSISSEHCNNHNRCFKHGIWGTCRRADFSGSLECRSEKLAHKLSGDEGCVLDNEIFSGSIKKQMCSSQKRQYKCSPIHKQTRGNQVIETMFFDLGNLAIGNKQSNHTKSSTYIGEEQYSGRCIESNQDKADRMDPQQGNCSENIFSLGGTDYRPVCFLGEQTDRSILYMDAGSESFSPGCIDNSLAQYVCSSLSSNLSDFENITLYEAVPMSTYINSSSVAEETLVHRNIATVNSQSNQTSIQGRSIESSQGENSSSRSSDVEINSLASLDRCFQTEGFSERARKLLTASWRKGTQKDYVAKFEKYNSWCNTKQIDPYSATLNQVADFLSYLFDQGLQYRTIAGYRSMLSAILPPVHNISVGQHPHIVRLIKGVFNSRPPKRKLLPEWDLEIVLQALEQKPFEPLDQVDIKFLTYKTAFLLAITTFKRCSDLQSLRIDEGSMKAQSKGITFIRHGLAKQDRPGHFGKTIFVPSYPEKELLDPKRALCCYLDRTKEMRNKLKSDEKVKLFLAISEPHKPVKVATISNWLVQTVKLAYSDQDMKVNAHSTRAIAPSWALFKGASISSILDSADWASESTFIKFYLRQVDATKVLE